jgi:hypothetical protein
MCWHAHERSYRRRADADFDDEDAQERRERNFVQHAQKAGTILLICLSIWLLTGAGYFWPVWVMLFLGLRVGIHAWHVYGQPLHADIDV